MTDQNTALIEISQADQALQRAGDIQDILDLRDKAAAFQLFANAQGFKDAAQKAKIFQLKAERKAGDWLDKNIKNGGNPESHDVILDDINVTPKESSRWQQEASLPEEKFTEWIDTCLEAGDEISASGLRRMAILETAKQDKVEPPPITGKYRIIYADPPWKYGDQFIIEGYKVSAEQHYPVMSIDELCNLPIKDLAEDNAVLFLWVTSPLLEDSFKIIHAWGFEYKTSFVWDKVKHNMGHYNSVRHEFLFICTRGSCTPDNPKLIDSVQIIERAEHSRKPEEFREIIDTLYLFGKKIELFARTKVEGWESWGNE